MALRVYSSIRAAALVCQSVSSKVNGNSLQMMVSPVSVLNRFMTNAFFAPVYYRQLTQLLDTTFQPAEVSLALDQALGDRKGIVRMGSAYVPMDEPLAFVALDLSGRPYAVIQAAWHTPAIGLLPTALIPHFLESFAIHAKINLHARVEYGRDDHHQAEALFKALGRALQAATRIEARRAEAVPSTKGTL